MVAYPLPAGLLLVLELLDGHGAAYLEGLELLLLEGPLVGDPGVLLDLALAAPAVLLGLLALLAVVLLDLAQHLVLRLERDALALALLALLRHLAADAYADAGGEVTRRRREPPVEGGREREG